MKSSKATDATGSSGSKLMRAITGICGLALLANLLTACAVRSDPAITASQGTPPKIEAISLLEADAAQSDRIELRDAIAQALIARNVSVHEGAPFVGDLAVSVNDAEVSLLTAQSGLNGPAPTPVIDIRESSFADECKAIRMRAQFAVFARSANQISKMVVAEAIGCEGDALPIHELAELLVTEIL
ncbi:hypothetical protein BPTFM16_00105 [Altererythrobacter insulae]|nr:hypothetical protein BPTFM16_00105 [Altererythrobacter insulae]